MQSNTTTQISEHNNQHNRQFRQTQKTKKPNQQNIQLLFELPLRERQAFPPQAAGGPSGGGGWPQLPACREWREAGQERPTGPLPHPTRWEGAWEAPPSRPRVRTGRMGGRAPLASPIGTGPPQAARGGTALPDRGLPRPIDRRGARPRFSSTGETCW